MNIKNKLPYPKNIAFSMGESKEFTCSNEELEKLMTDALSEKENEALMLYFKEQLSYVKTAMCMNVCYESTRNLVRKGVLKLKHPKNRTRLFPDTHTYLAKIYFTTESKLKMVVEARTEEEAKFKFLDNFYKGCYDDYIKLIDENVTEFSVEEVQK